MSGRDPFPSPRREDDFSLSGFRPQQKTTLRKPTHIAQTEEPWSRLHDTVTLSSSLRSVTHPKTQAPKDSLDFQLKAVYDHHKDIFKTKNQFLFQAETVCEEQRKQEKLRREMLEKEQAESIRMWVDPQKCSIYSIK